MSELKICLFGGAQVSWGDGRQLVRLSRPSQALLGFLVVNRHRTHQREVLASILWDEVDDARARHRINTALWRLRRALAAPDPRADECRTEAGRLRSGSHRRNPQVRARQVSGGCRA